MRTSRLKRDNNAHSTTLAPMPRFMSSRTEMDASVCVFTNRYEHDATRCYNSNANALVCGFMNQGVKLSGETGIRTLGAIAGTTVFETAPIDRSGISPRERKSTELAHNANAPLLQGVCVFSEKEGFACRRVPFRMDRRHRDQRSCVTAPGT